MVMTEASFRCESRRFDRFLALCEEVGDEPGDGLADLVRLEVQRRERRKARSDEVIDERPLVRLRLLVAEATAESDGWPGLRAALARRDLILVPAGGGLNVVNATTLRTICKLSQVGPGYAALVRRFGAGFPGHPHAKLVRRVLAKAAKPALR